jgi:ribonucleoside-diphosphate reductase subunit M1
MYYLRTRPAVDAIQFTVDKLALKSEQETGANHSQSQADAEAAARLQCSIDNKDACLMCSG